MKPQTEDEAVSTLTTKWFSKRDILTAGIPCDWIRGYGWEAYTSVFVKATCRTIKDNVLTDAIAAWNPSTNHDLTTLYCSVLATFNW